MKHGKSCDCAMCKIGKSMGMIKKEEKNTEVACSCGSGEKATNCSVDHSHDK